MSQDKKEFLFSYQRRSGDKVAYRVLYDHELQKIQLIEKTINGNLQLRLEEEVNKPDCISNELSAMFEDITRNVDKKLS